MQQQHRQQCVELQYSHPTWYGAKIYDMSHSLNFTTAQRIDTLTQVVIFAEHWPWLVQNLFGKAHSQRGRSKPGTHAV